jgi:hypothetical protein
LPVSTTIGQVEYRIAYFAFCIEYSDAGIALLQDLKTIRATDPDIVQFGSAHWFWQRQVNSYALQLEPDRYKHLDKAMLDYQEALHIERVRDAFFHQLQTVLHDRRR